jgi:hypothetical protein
LPISPDRLAEIVGDIYLMTYDLSIATRKMHQTTVRFGPDLWQAVEEECGRLGVSVAQYLREAALTRLVYAAGRRGDEEFEFALELVKGGEPHGDLNPDLELVRAPARSARKATERAIREASEARAVAAQGRLARQRARELRILRAKQRIG